MGYRWSRGWPLAAEEWELVFGRNYASSTHPHPLWESCRFIAYLFRVTKTIRVHCYRKSCISAYFLMLRIEQYVHRLSSVVGFRREEGLWEIPRCALETTDFAKLTLILDPEDEPRLPVCKPIVKQANRLPHVLFLSCLLYLREFINKLSVTCRINWLILGHLILWQNIISSSRLRRTGLLGRDVFLC